MEQTNFAEIIFNSRFHTYRYGGKRLQAVTKVCGRFKKPFERDYWAQRKADERGVNVADILAEWEVSGAAGREKGKRVHDYIRQVLSPEQAVKDDPFLALNEWPIEAEIFRQLWRQRLSTYAEPLWCEWVVGDAALGIAGTIDAVFRHRDTKEHHIFDWKTNRKFTTGNPWKSRSKKLLPPFDDLEECDLNFYSLQVSLYKLILRRNTDLPLDTAGLGHSYIVHLEADGYQIHQALDLSDRLLAALEGEELGTGGTE